VLDVAMTLHEPLQLGAVLEVRLQRGPHREGVAVLHVLDAPPDRRGDALVVIAGDGRRIVDVLIEHAGSSAVP
jgi:hypothetical protein